MERRKRRQFECSVGRKKGMSREGKDRKKERHADGRSSGTGQ